MSAPISNLQDLLQRQHSTSSSYINNQPIIVPFSSAGAGAGTSTDPNPTTPNTTTIAFSVLKPKLPRKKPNPISLPKTATATATGIIPPCTECGKRFSSWKALFGHMRCHPERQWRGINPPAKFRRGGGGPLPNFTSEEYEVASSLILLANGPSPRDEGGPRAWAAVALLGCEHHNSSSSSSRCHKCSICLRGFSSGQALGGHMRCHWDTKVEVEDTSFAASDSRDFVLDLNLPPPAAGTGDLCNNNEAAAAAVAVSDASVLDLRLGM